jgi:inner membrane protein
MGILDAKVAFYKILVPNDRSDGGPTSARYGKLMDSLTQLTFGAACGEAVLGQKVGRKALGTQIFWPFDTTPKALPVLFIIDPLFTLPIILGILAVLLLKRHRSLGHRLNAIGLALGLTYLIWAIGTGEFVKRRVTEKLTQQEVSCSRFISSPAPFTTLLWRVVGIDNDRYFETYFSLFDRETPLSIDFYPRNLALMTGIEEHPPVVKLEKFTRGYFAFSNADGYVIMTDLRMGSEPDYVFRFKVARLNGPHPTPIDDERLKTNLDWRRLAWVWRRIWKPGPDVECGK